MSSLFLLKIKELGYDVDHAMERCLNDEDFYLQCMQITLDDQSFENLGKALDNNDVQEAFEYAHTLKGVWANVGLSKLYEMIIPVVEKLRIGHIDGLKPDYDKIKVEYDKIKELYTKTKSE